MTHDEKREYLIKELLSELPQYSDMKIPEDEERQKNLLRSLMNIRRERLFYLSKASFSSVF